MGSARNKVLLEAYKLGYRISDDGKYLNPKGKILRGHKHGSGYLEGGIVTISSGKRKTEQFSLHRLQAYQKFGDTIFAEGIVVRHLDGNPLNNSFSNIEIGTQKDNALDIPKETRKRTGKNAASFLRKLSEKEAKEIRKLRQEGWKYKDLMKKFNIKSKATISYICNNKTYQ